MKLLAATVLALAVLVPSSPQAADPAPPPPPPATAAPAPPPPAAPAAKPHQEEYSGFVALKGGYFNMSGDYQGDSFSDGGMWEFSAGSGLGAGKFVGFEFSTGTSTTTAGNLKVKTIPIQIGLRLQFPIAMLVPYGELGVGAYFNRFTNINTGAGVDGATGGWFGGLGCDVLLGRFLVGGQVRYVGISAATTIYGTVVLDRYEALLKAGIQY